MNLIEVTDANYGNPVLLNADHITACTIVADNTYRDGMIPDGVWRRTIIYTIGGNQICARETPEEVWKRVRQSGGR